MRGIRTNYYIYRLLYTTLVALAALVAAPPAAAQTVTAEHNLFHILFTDADGSGGVTCGDTINFVAQIGSAVSGVDLENAVWTFNVPANASVVPGSVVASNPNDSPQILSGNAAGDRRIEVRLGRICRSGDCTQFGATVQFFLTVDDPNSATELTVQAELTGSNFSPTPSDALETTAKDDPTVIAYPACPATPPSVPILTAIKRDEVLLDSDGDRLADGGDTLRYTVLVRSVGSGTPEAPVYRAVPDPRTSLVVGSVTTTGGTILRGNRAGDGSVEVSLGSLPPGAAVTLTYNVRITSTVPAGVDRVACQGEVSGSNFRTLPTDDPDTPELSDPTVTPLDFDPDLRLGKADGGAVASPSGRVLYTLTWGNPSRSPAAGVVLTDTVPIHARADLGASSPGWSCPGTGAPGEACTLVVGDLPPGAAGEAIFAVRMAAAVPKGFLRLTNTAVLIDDGSQGPELNPADNTATDTTPLEGFSPDLAVAKSDRGASIEPGGTVVYRLTATNLGSRGAAGVTLTETVPEHTRFAAGESSPGWSCTGSDAAGSVCTLTLGGLTAGGTPREATFAVTLDATVPAGLTEILNTVSVADDGTAGPDANPANNTASETTPLAGAMPELTVEKTLDPVSSPTPGGRLLWHLAYANSGNQDATGVALAETVPEHTTFWPEDSDPRWSCAGTGPGSLCRLELGDVAAGDSSSVTFAVTLGDTLPGDTQAIENCVELGAARACNVVQPEGFVVDLGVAKSDHGAVLEPGGTVVYRLTVSNAGSRGAAGVTLTETVPEHTRFAAGDSSPGWSCTGSGAAGSVCTLALGGLVAGGASREATFAVTLEATVPAGLNEIVNTVSVADDGTAGPDADPANNTATETTPLAGAMPDLSVEKTLDPASSPTPGGRLFWHLAYANTGNQDAAGVALSETVPAETTFRPEDSDPRWSCAGTGPGSLCRLELGDLAAGESGSVTFAVTLDDSLPAGVEVVQNCAEIGVAESCHSVPVDAAPDLSLSKDDGGATVLAGGRVVYSLTVTNHGTQDATGVVVTDRLPAGSTFSEVGSSPGWSCTAEPPGSPVCSFLVGSLPAGASRTLTLALLTDDEAGGTVLTNTAETTDDGSGGADPNPDDNTASDTTPVEEPPPPPVEPFLEVDLVDEPFDIDGGGLGTADTITYIAFVTNRGATAAEDVVFVVEPHPATHLLADSVAASQGTVLEGHAVHDTRVAVELGRLPAGETAQILLTVEIDEERPPELAEIVVQGLATASNAPEEPSDDPDTLEDDDPTRTPLARVPQGTPEDIPTLSELGFSLFALFLATGAVIFLRRRTGGPDIDGGGPA